MTTSIRSRRRPRRAATGRLVATALMPLLPALLTSAAAQEAEEPTPLYQVELIVFANRGFDPGEELLARHAAQASRALQSSEPVLAEFDFGPAEEELPFGTDLRDRVFSDAASAEPSAVAADAGAAAGASVAAGVATDTGAAPENVVAGADTATPPDPFAGAPATAQFRFRLLRPDELELTAVSRRLDADSSQYDVLLHGGWLQDGLPLESAQPFNLAYLGRGNPSGTVRLHISRFVHVALDLDYRVPTGPGAIGLGLEGMPGSGAFDPTSPARGRTTIGGGTTIGGWPGSSVRATRDALQPIEITPRYRLRQERRMRSGEAHYIDHPAFGVIIVVRPWEPPVEEPVGAEREGGLRPAA